MSETADKKSNIDPKYAPFVNAYKMFKITGKGYIMVIQNVLFGMDIDFNGIYYMQLSPTDSLPPGEIVACNLDDLLCDHPFPFDRRIFNMLNDRICFYTFGWPDYQKLDNDTMVERVYNMKSNDDIENVVFHVENDINVEYMLPIFYKMFPVSKGDDVDAYIRTHMGTYIVKFIIHKKKQHLDIIVFRRFLKIV